jgi:hypothetical protein
MKAWFVAILVAGAVLRAMVIPRRAPAVDDSWLAWSYHGAIQGPAHLYGPRGHVVRFDGVDSPVVYPPLALDEFALIGRVYLTLARGGMTPAGLGMAVKSTIVLLDAVLAGVIFFIVRRARGLPAAQFAAAAYWINPAVLMTTTLGYVDVFVALPALLALAAASRGRPWIAGALCTAAVMTKPQGIFLVPAVMVTIWHAGDEVTRITRLIAGASGAAAALAVLAAPVIAAGHGYDMVRSVAVLAGHDALSALACNAWWIVSYLIDVSARSADGLRVALQTPAGMHTHADAIARGLPHPRILTALLAGPVMAWTLWVGARAKDLGRQAALGALVVAVYFTLSAQVHENHFFLILPFLIVAAALHRAFIPVLVALSAAFALNLYLMLGLDGDGVPPAMIMRTWIDATVLLAIAICALFGWLAATFARLCLRPLPEVNTP